MPIRRLRALFFFIFILLLPSINAQNRDSVIYKFFAENGIPITYNNRLTFLTSGASKFKDLFSAIRQAKHSVHLEYFNFRNDSIANALFDLLIVKAQEGVKVRALFDAFGNASNNKPLKKEHLRRLRSKGVEIYKYDPLRFPWINHALSRDHRKIVIIDGQIAYTGGMNVADYYINGTKEVGNWRDMHMRIEGDAVAELQKIFLRIWNRTTRQNIHGEEYYPGEKNDTQGFIGLTEDTCNTAGKKELAIVNREPHFTPKIIRQTFLTAINSANSTIQIVNPYFTLNHKIKSALEKAIQRGVRVEIMVSEASDIPITPRIVDYTVRQLMKKGAHVYYYQKGFHHSKIMMIDKTYSFVGSANLNSRSLSYDYECNVMIFDPETTSQLIRIFEQDKQEHCIPLTNEYWGKRKKWKNFQGWLFHFLRPFVFNIQEMENEKSTETNRTIRPYIFS